MVVFDGFNDVQDVFDKVSSDIFYFTKVTISTTQVYNHLSKSKDKWVRLSYLSEI